MIPKMLQIFRGSSFGRSASFFLLDRFDREINSYYVTLMTAIELTWVFIYILFLR